MVKSYEMQAEAHDAVKEFFVGRNAARGTYPKRVSLKREFLSLDADGTTHFQFMYKGETVLVDYQCYKTVVTFPL